MKKFILMCAMLGFAAQSHAVSGSWSKDTLHYTIYASNTAATMPFRSTTYMSTGASYVTSLSWQWTPYANGNFSEVVQICYSGKYSTVIGGCRTYPARQGTTQDFNGLDASGTFWVRHTLVGGSYPAVSSTADRISVVYQ
ncbi:hypothetical protein [Aquaspirillum sp. LM1]|jgi:hypothetical protein|uniref:hypothetical protein n=1 Tax=Aquaspirillum sp. LM1 TaxID=1938604 RepID=UPI00123742FC|nr:hypothetical protein [Aquaspirillum sp. LM1]